MTKLIVTPLDFDPDQPGSFRDMSLIARMQTAVEQGDNAGLARAWVAAEDLVLRYVRTDDGSLVRPLLDELSINQFSELLGALLQSPVPTESDDSSDILG